MVPCLYSARSGTSSLPPGNEEEEQPRGCGFRADPVLGWSIRFAPLLRGLQIPTLIFFRRKQMKICTAERYLCTLPFVCLFRRQLFPHSVSIHLRKICSGLNCLRLCNILKQCIQLLQLEPKGEEKKTDTI